MSESCRVEVAVHSDGGQAPAVESVEFNPGSGEFAIEGTASTGSSVGVSFHKQGDADE